MCFYTSMIAEKIIWYSNFWQSCSCSSTSLSTIILHSYFYWGLCYDVVLEGGRFHSELNCQMGISRVSWCTCISKVHRKTDWASGSSIQSHCITPFKRYIYRTASVRHDFQQTVQWHSPFTGFTIIQTS